MVRLHYKKSVFRSLAMVTQLGLCVITPVLLCIFLGYQIDTRTDEKTMIPLLILGVFAGGRCAWQMVRRTLQMEIKEDERILQEKKERSVRQGISKPKPPSRVYRAEGTQTRENMQKGDRTI